MISNSSHISIKIVDLTTDEILFEKSKSWDEGNAGDRFEYYPVSAKEAWKLISKPVNKKLREFAITGDQGTFEGDKLQGRSIDVMYKNRKDLSIQHWGNYPINIKIKILKEGKDYHLYATSDKLGQKKISTIKGSDAYKISPNGYLINPKRTRIGLILEEKIGGPYLDYLIIGCNLKVGYCFI